MRVSNREMLPELLYQALAENRPPVDGEIHTTQIIGPPMIDHLRRKHWEQLETDASDRLFALLGSGLHAAIANDGRIEHAKKVLKDTILFWDKVDRDIQLCVLQDLIKSLESTNQSGIESTLSLKLKGDEWTLVGTDDHYNELTAKIMDWKITSVWSVLFADHNWEEQLNVYAYMRRKLGYEVKSLEVWALLRDWQKSKALYGGDHKYPKIPFVRCELPLWSLKKQEEYIYGRLLEFTDKPKPCTPRDKWQTATVYKVMKQGRKSALIATRWVKGEKQEFLSVAEALEAAAAHTKKQGGRTVADKIVVDGAKIFIQEFPGENKRCELYCVCNKFCKAYQEENKNE